MKTLQKDFFTVEWTDEGVIPIFQDMGNFAPLNLVKLPIIPFKDYISFINNELQKMMGEEQSENTSGIITFHGSRVSIQIENKETNIVYRVSKIKKSVWVEFFMSQYQKLLLLTESSQ